MIHRKDPCRIRLSLDYCIRPTRMAALMASYRTGLVRLFRAFEVDSVFLRGCSVSIALKGLMM